MKPASAIRSGRAARSRRPAAPRNPPAALAAGARAPRRSRCRARRALASPAASARSRDHARDLRRESRRRGRRGAIAVMLQPRPEMRIDEPQRRSGAHLVDDDAARPPARTSPISCACSPRALQELDRRLARCAAGTMTTMPMPQLKVRYISRRVDARRRAAASRTPGRAASAPRRARASSAIRQHARDVVGEAAAGDVRQAVHRQRRHQREQRLHVDAGRRQQRVGQRLRRRACVVRSAPARVDELADQRVAVRVQPGGGEADAPHRPARSCVPSMMRVLLDDADAEAGEVVVARRGTCRASRPSRRRPARSRPARSPRRCRAITASATSTSSLPVAK